MNIILLIILSFFLGTIFGFIIAILLSFSSHNNEHEEFLKDNNSDHYEQ